MSLTFRSSALLGVKAASRLLAIARKMVTVMKVAKHLMNGNMKNKIALKISED